jgi:putative endonuclease
MEVSKTNYTVTKTVLYTGITNCLEQRLVEHYLEKDNPLSNAFTAKYKAIYLIYYESYNYVNDAIAREKRSKNGEEKKG